MEVEATFHSGLGEDWQVPGSYFISVLAGKAELQALVTEILGKQADLGFTLNDLAITGSLEEALNKQQISTESKVRIEFYMEIPPIQSRHSSNAEDWVSHVKIHDKILASDYSGSLSIHFQGQVLKTVKIAEGPVKSFDVSDEEIVLAGLKGDFYLTDLELQVLAHGKTERLEKVCWSPLMTTFALGGTTGGLSVGRTSEDRVTKGAKRIKMSQESLKCDKLSFGHTDKVTGLEWPFVESLVSASWDHQILASDLEKGAIESSVLCPRAVQAFRYVGNLALAGFENGAVFGYDMRSTAKSLQFNCKYWVRALSVNGNAVVVAGETGDLQVFDMRSCVVAREVIQAHQGKVLAVDSKELRIVSAGADGVVREFTMMA